ncbi:zinc finger CCCH domain-containing protein 18-like [Gossypium australe]|uniref:Zinc finger CCCH domain-containing protein 18-like n=1 Tax=Gossypium australe TaxID=47621 RepID=A0A5B6U9S0_9ROSI|nr:zinc finger CCCH domain-containing protein 18-like [Gossypium australe]
MEFSDYTQILFNKIKKFEPENVLKIIGYILLQDHGEQEIAQLALCPDKVIQEVIYKIKLELQQLALKSGSPPISPSMNSVTTLNSEIPSQFTSFSPPVSSSTLDDQMGSLNLRSDNSFSNDYCYCNFGVRPGLRRHQNNVPDFPVKTCHYFNKGYCKHGSNCRYFHGEVSDNLPQMFVHLDGATGYKDHVMSLEKLEVELVELLRTKRGDPVSIASLPLLYYEKYGKVLQADGYLTESQRHGKAGYSLTKLLARLKNAIRVIDRPHGQHAVILAEDVPKYMENRNDRNDPGPIVNGSRQIYLTFPADSTFSEDDVSNYFRLHDVLKPFYRLICIFIVLKEFTYLCSNYGQVEDVRIPCQQKRMFGFVTFVSSDTVKMILAKGNPHYVCGARVLVKPYREKSKLVDRKYPERIESPMYFSSYYMEPELHSIPKGYATSRLFRKQFIEDQDQIFKLQRRHSSEMHLSQKPLAHQSFGYFMDELKVTEGSELSHFMYIRYVGHPYNAFFSTKQINSISRRQSSIICWKLSTSTPHLMEKSNM